MKKLTKLVAGAMMLLLPTRLYGDNGFSNSWYLSKIREYAQKDTRSRIENSLGNKKEYRNYLGQDEVRASDNSTMFVKANEDNFTIYLDDNNPLNPNKIDGRLDRVLIIEKDPKNKESLDSRMSILSCDSQTLDLIFKTNVQGKGDTRIIYDFTKYKIYNFGDNTVKPLYLAQANKLQEEYRQLLMNFGDSLKND